jgi:hypothetical protein
MKHCLLLLSLIATFAAGAQTQKGNWLIGSELASADAAFYSGNNDVLDNIGLSIFPRAGYFVRDNFAIGSRLVLAASFSKPGAFFSLGAQPFVRRYFGEKKLRFFGEGGIGYNHYISTGSSNGTVHNSHFIAHLGPGAAYFIAPNVALETSLQLQAGKAAGMPIVYSPRLLVGFQVYLQKEKNEDEQKTEN